MRIEYKDHDFCKDKLCQQLGPDDKCNHIVCVYSAKAFHKWLKSNGYKIIKECYGEKMNEIEEAEKRRKNNVSCTRSDDK